MDKEQKSPWVFRAFFLSFFVVLVFFFPDQVLSASDGLGRSVADASATPAPTAVLSFTPTQTPESSVSLTYGDELLEAYLQLPSGPVAAPYLILNAVEFGANSGDLTIQGGFRDKTFSCSKLPCKVPFFESDNISFSAYSSAGNLSERIFASVNVSETDAGYVLTLDSISTFENLSDSCKAEWNVVPEYGLSPVWAEFPQFYYQLNTNRTLHYLAARLILNGIVDSSECVDGGISKDFSWPTSCGLEKARDTMISWQNQYDPQIWTVGKEIGIPPKILKTLIQEESQFWPGNQRFYVDEYGLGQVTQLGLDVLLRDDYLLFQSVCTDVFNNCENLFYNWLSPQQQSLIRGALLERLNANCLYCEGGFDFSRAKQSVDYVGRLVKANCNAVDSILSNLSYSYTYDRASYDDYWKFTLYTYHSGVICFQAAADLTLSKGQEMTWDNLSENTSCVDGKTYVDGFWTDLTTFDTYLIKSDVPGTMALADAVFDEPPTPTAYPTPIPSSAKVEVQVSLENADGEMRPLTDVPVLVSLGNGTELMETTLDGFVFFDLDGYPTSSIVTVSLPGLYQSEIFILPPDGTTKIHFLFSAPTLPLIFP